MSSRADFRRGLMQVKQSNDCQLMGKIMPFCRESVKGKAREDRAKALTFFDRENGFFLPSFGQMQRMLLSPPYGLPLNLTHNFPVGNP